MSTLKVNTLEEATSGGATFYTAKAWMKYDQVALSLINSGNVSSVTDVATGRYTTSFANAFSAASYCAGSIGFRRVAETNPKFVNADGDDTQATTSSTLRTSRDSSEFDVESNLVSWTL